MADCFQDIPAICLNVGPMLNGHLNGELVGSGTIVWKARELLASGEADTDQYMDMISRGYALSHLIQVPCGWQDLIICR